jgi:O-antigen ligase
MPRTNYFLAILLLCLPWLNPFAPGPSPAIAPWLFSMGSLVAVLLFFAVFSGDAAERRTASGYVSRYKSTLAFGWSLLIAGAISCAFALLQYFDVEGLFAPWINPTEPGYAFANLRQRNQFASLTNLGLAVLLVWAMVRGDEKPDAGIGAMALATAALMAVGNAASSSRTGGVQLFLLGAMFAVWGGWRVRGVRWVWLTAMAAYAVAAVALPYAAGFDWAAHGLFARLQAGDVPCASRITLWSNVLHLIAQKPWLGWGWGELDYAHFITLYDQPRFCDILDNAHNLPLHLAVELGVPLAVLMCGGFGWWVVRQKPWAERDASRRLAWAVIALILLHSMLEYPLWYGPFQIASGWSIYILWSTRRTREQEVSNRPLAHVIRAPTATVLIAIMGCLAYAAWDYHRVSQIYLQPEQRSAAYRDNTVLKIRDSWLFADQARFAELLLTPVTPATAAWVLNAADRTLHYSPEPRVVEKAIESAVMLGRDEEAMVYLAAYRAAFPSDHARWATSNLQTSLTPNNTPNPTAD